MNPTDSAPGADSRTMGPANSRVTMRDVAHRLNVSHTTVSRALRNDPRISETMRQRVQEIAQQMGHRPDPLLSALAQYRHGKLSKNIKAELAWINQWQEPELLHSYRELECYWKGALKEAESSGFRLEEFVINQETTPERVQRILLARNIQGILIPPHGSVELNWRGFNWENFCVVRFGYSVASPRAHIVTSDQLTDGLLAFENIWSLGYRRIGMVSYRKQGTRMTRFLAGYLYAQMQMTTSDELLPPFFLEENNPHTDQRKFIAWLKRNKPDAILTDVVALREMLLKASYRVPQDVGLAALSILDGNADAGIDQNSHVIGRAAVQMLISLINHNERGIPDACRELLIEGRWVNGRSLPPKSPD